MSINIKPLIFISAGALLFSLGCATRPVKIVTPPKQEQKPVGPPVQETEVRPGAPAREEAESPKESQPSEPVPTQQIPQPRSTVPGTGQTDRSAPRTVASLRLTEQARLLIESKKPDDAISILEKAMNIDATNGQNYYYLAEAWIMKGNKSQATEFNRMAGLYLKDEGTWMTKVRQQKDRIQKIEGGR